jgi:uncharacterized protein YhhL (DUF1145 family)
MSASQLRQAKWALSVLWVLAAACFFAPADSSIGAFGQIIFWLMLVAHAIECVVFWGTLKGTGKPLGGQIAQTLLFGVVHYQTIKKDT